jgi:hypothetical protein
VDEAALTTIPIIASNRTKTKTILLINFLFLTNRQRTLVPSSKTFGLFQPSGWQDTLPA